MNKREPKFWVWDNEEETLNSCSISEAIEAYREHLAEADEGMDLPARITIYGFAPMEVNGVWSAKAVCETLLERFDDDFSNPYETDAMEPTPAMLAAAQALIDVVEREYVPWACEQVCTVVVDTATGEIVEGES